MRSFEAIVRRWHRTRVRNTQFRRPTEHSSSDAERRGDAWHIECRLGKIQLKGSIRISDDLYVSSTETMKLSVETRLFAANLSLPLEGQLQFRLEAVHRKLSLDYLRAPKLDCHLQTKQGQQWLRDNRRTAENP